MTRPLRVLQVHAHGADPAVGGVGKHLTRLGLRLPERGFEVYYLAAFEEATPPPGPTVTLHDDHWKTSRVRRIRNHAGDLVSRPTQRLEAAVRASGADVLHTHNLPCITTAVWEVARRLGIPVVHTVHDYQLLCPRVTLLRPDGEACRPNPTLCGARTRRLARWSGGVNLVLGPTAYVLRAHADVFDPQIMRVVRNPYDDAATSVRIPPPRRRLEALGYLGRLDHTKGVRQLLAAAPALAQHGCSLRIAGDGKLRAEVEEATRSLPNVEYAGVVRGRQKSDFLESCDAGIVPSIWPEPAGPANVMLEWLSAGRPVLSSPRGGLAEAIATSGGAIAVEPAAAAIADAVGLLRDPVRFGAAVAAISTVPHSGDEDRWIDEHADIFRRVVAGQHIHGCGLGSVPR